MSCGLVWDYICAIGGRMEAKYALFIGILCVMLSKQEIWNVKTDCA